MSEQRLLSSRIVTGDILNRVVSQLSEQQKWALYRLLCYPFLRAEDLLVYVKEIRSRSASYRVLTSLGEAKLIERVIPGNQDTSCYHLSNLGLHVVAACLKRSPVSLAEQY